MYCCAARPRKPCSRPMRSSGPWRFSLDCPEWQRGLTGANSAKKILSRAVPPSSSALRASYPCTPARGTERSCEYCTRNNEPCKCQRIKQLLTRKRVEKPARGFGKSFHISRFVPGGVPAMLVLLRTVHLQLWKLTRHQRVVAVAYSTHYTTVYTVFTTTVRYAIK